MSKFYFKIFTAVLLAFLGMVNVSSAQVAPPCVTPVDPFGPPLGPAPAEMIKVDTSTSVGIGANEVITLFATGNEAVDQANFTVIIDDGTGQPNGPGLPIVEIVNFAPAGFLAGANTSFAGGTSAFNIAAVFDLEGTATQVGLGSNPFAELIVDTTGLSVGDTFELRLSESTVSGISPPFTSAFELSGNSVFTTFAAEPFVITVGVPEPSSVMVLVGLSGFVSLRRRRA